MSSSRTCLASATRNATHGTIPSHRATIRRAFEVPLASIVPHSVVRDHRATAEHKDVHDADIPDNIKQFVRRTFSTKELASQLVAQPEAPNQHVGYINGVLHVFDENIPNDPALSEDFARARDALIAASRQSQQRQVTQQPQGLNNVTPLDNGVPIPNGSVALSAAATPVPTGSPGSSAFLTPPQLYYKVAETGQSKVTLPFGKVCDDGVFALYTQHTPRCCCWVC